ncbi:hypothetical protein SAY87_006572 [Trapa incisa]|uniref:Transcriptional corepressor LEUNIG n=1 Tax=Trapa incisa TaxID=236973 RepID=A0AAN7K2L2_9MYRT|nr:hypothetical protein SAY87_006572 [Trapa incisa]
MGMGLLVGMVSSISMLDVYIHDYLVKRNLKATAQAFQTEGKVSSDPVAIDAPGGFLFEWWSVFWDIFIARTNEKHSEVAASYIEVLMKIREEQQQKSQLISPRQHQMQMLMQCHAQQQPQAQPQQQRDGASVSNPIIRQNPGANALATKMYVERLKHPLPRDSLNDDAMKQSFGDNMVRLLDSNNPSLLKSSDASGQTSGQVLHGTAGTMNSQVQARNQQLQGPAPDIKPEVNPVFTPRAVGSEQQKPFMQSRQPFHQLQMLSPHHQQQLMFTHNLTSPSSSDENRQIRMLLNSRMVFGKDGPSTLEIRFQMLGLLCRREAQLHQQQQQLQPNTTMRQQIPPNNAMQQQLQQHGPTNQLSQGLNQNIHQQDKLGGAGNMTMKGNVSNSLRGNDQVFPFLEIPSSADSTGRKWKQPGSSSGPANSTGTANTVVRSPSSAPSTPSTHTPSDVITMPNLPHSGSSLKPLIMFGTDCAGTLISPSNQLADMDRFVEDGSIDDNVESFLSHDDIDPRDTVGLCMDISKGFTLNEVNTVRASTNKVVCCHFSSDGKLLASGGHDKKVGISPLPKTTLEEHTSMITDVRFSPSMPRLATSSFDKTVRVWDADNPGYTLCTFMGHNATVTSLDFHPNKDDLICSCDGYGEMRYWSINNGNYARVSKGGMTKLRFQPRQGRYLATTAENMVSILDVETQICRTTFQGHTKSILSTSWDSTGDLLASVSEDSVRIWTVGSGSEGDCIHELSCNGNKFHSCIFHPTCPSTLVIGCYQIEYHMADLPEKNGVPVGQGIRARMWK